MFALFSQVQEQHKVSGGADGWVEGREGERGDVSRGGGVSRSRLHMKRTAHACEEQFNGLAPRGNFHIQFEDKSSFLAGKICEHAQPGWTFTEDIAAVAVFVLIISFKFCPPL